MPKFSHSLLVDHMHFSFYVSSAPYEISLYSVNLFSNIKRKSYELHGMIGDVVQSGFS